jgi:hypothetical protein
MRAVAPAATGSPTPRQPNERRPPIKVTCRPEAVHEVANEAAKKERSYKGWNDGDLGLLRSIWCLIRHQRPTKIVETGVAHGVTSRIILEALNSNGGAHLWSIDYPPLDTTWHAQIGIAVGNRFADRWTYIKGSSRRRLSGLLSSLGPIDLFVHDSLHSTNNVRFMTATRNSMDPNESAAFS